MNKIKESVIIDLSSELEKSKPYLDKFHKASNFNKSRQEAYAENMAFYQGNQHLLKKFKNETPWVVNMNTPYATIAIDNRVSSLLANDYIGELLPLSEQDVQPIEALSEVYKREWRRMDLDDVVRACIRGSAVVREFYCHIVLNPGKSIGAVLSKPPSTEIAGECSFGFNISSLVFFGVQLFHSVRKRRKRSIFHKFQHCFQCHSTAAGSG